MMERGLFALERDAWSAPFFDGAARGELLILRCGDCHEHSSPQARRCAFCSSDNVSWVPVSGQGRVVSWVAPHVREGDTTAPAYVVALVELSEGPWIYVHGSSDLRLDVDQDVTVGFTSVADGEPLPVVHVANDSPAAGDLSSARS